MLRIGVVMYQTSLTKGQELVAERMVREFRRQGYDAYLITSIYEDWELAVSIEEVTSHGGYLHVYDERLRIPLVRVDSYQGTWPPRRIYFRNFMDILRHIVEELKLNVLVTHSTLWNGPEEVAKFIGWRRELIASGSIHEPVLFCHMSHFQEPSDERYTLEERSYREAWNDFSLSKIIVGADLLLVATPAEGDLMRKLGAKESNLLLFPGGIDDDLLDTYTDSSTLRDKYEIPKNSKLVAYLGTVEERKNVLPILHLAEMLSTQNEVHWAIAGRLEGEYGNRVKEEAGKHRNISLLGPIPEEDKAGLIRESYLNISLSRAEALGIAQLEFMYGGVPVITSGIGGQSWIVKDGETGVVLDGPDDVEGASRAITNLVSHPSQRKRLGRNAARFAWQFSLTRLIHRLSTALFQRFQKGEEGTSQLKVEPTEKVLEAWVKNNYRVVVTTQKLTIVPLKKAKEAVSIQLNEIKKIRYHVKAFWSALWVGAGATLLFIGARILGWNWDVVLKDELYNLVSVRGFSIPQSSLVTPSIIFLPLIVSAIVFVLTAKGGYLILFDASKGTFVPKTFTKALRLAEKLTPEELFPKE